jgi:2,4-diaminopentanoate dehydrogenase
MERRLRIAQYGCGKMPVYTMRYAMEKGAEIVCAFGRSPQSLGKDIGDIAGVGKTGVLVQDSHHYHREPDARSQGPVHGLCRERRQCHHDW